MLKDSVQTVQVELRYLSEFRADVGNFNACRGWYFPGRETSSWLNVIASLQAFGEMRYFLAPTSASDANPDGLLCLDTIASVDDRLRRTSAGLMETGMPLHRVAKGMQGELWLPCNGELFPVLPPSSYLETLPEGESRVYVWLPSCGLVGFEAADAIHPSSLIVPPNCLELDTRHWTSPPQGVVVHERLTMVRLETPPSLEDLFEAERQEIGGEPLGADSPFGTDDAGGGMKGMILAWMQKMATGIANSLQPKNTANQGRADGENANKAARNGNPVARAISQKLHAWLSRSLEGKRNAQLEKFLRMMQKNPDAALKFALPLAGAMGGLFRGLAMPSWKLRAGNADFSLGGGGGLADFWNIGGDMQQRLRAAYIAQANREVALKRYRRAAYIYAHLLGDLTTAAALLENGEHFVEAAVLYADKLNRPRDQARCLALAGQASEAARIWESLSDYEAAGDAWSEADESELARAAYENACSAFIDRHDIASAVRIIDEKLHDRPRAKVLLWEQWPSGSAAFSSAEKGFLWLSEEGAHREAEERLEQMASTCRDDHLQMLGRLAVGIFQRYPDGRVKEVAEDIARVATAKKLKAVSPMERDQRITTLAGMAMHDPLLAKDAFRFMREQTSSATTRPAPRKLVLANRKAVLQRLPALVLPRAERYLLIQTIGVELFAVARDKNHIKIVRGFDLTEEKPTIVTEVGIWENGSPDAPLGVNVFHEPSLKSLLLWGARDTIRFAPLNLRKPHAPSDLWKVVGAGFDTEVASAAGGDATRLTVHRRGEFLELQGRNNNAVHTLDLTPAIQAALQLHQQTYFVDWSLDPDNVHLGVLGDQLYVAIDWIVLTIDKGTATLASFLPGSPKQLVTSPVYSRKRIALATANSLTVLRLDTSGMEAIQVCDQLGYELACWHDRFLLAVSGTNLRMFERAAQGGALALDHSLTRPPISVMSFGHKTLAVGFSEGRIERFRCE